jgi:prophage regulatory protein
MKNCVTDIHSKLPASPVDHHVPEQAPVGRLLRLPDVLNIIPVSRSTWYEGVRLGHYPKPVRLSARTSAWSEASIRQLAERLARA